MQTTISIALATYNGARYLREQLDSILRQTVPFSELVISDDASTDDTWRIITEYAAKDARINAYRNETNIGFIANFEKALSHCTGDYIALSDQDDIWLPQHIELLLTNIGDKMLCCANASLIDMEGRRLKNTMSYYLNRDWIPDSDLEKVYSIFFYRAWVQGATMLICKKLLIKGLPFPNNIGYHDLWLSCLACFVGGISYIPDIVTLYRQHNNTVTEAPKKESRFRSLISKLLNRNKYNNRKNIILGIRKRLGNELNIKQRQFLDTAEEYYNDWGGKAKFLFNIKHYKKIYNCNKWLDMFS